MIHANPSKQPKIMQQNYKNMNPQEDHLVDTKCHSIDCSLKFKRKSMKTVDDKSAKCLMSIYQIGQRSDNRTRKKNMNSQTRESFSGHEMSKFWLQLEDPTQVYEYVLFQTLPLFLIIFQLAFLRNLDSSFPSASFLHAVVR